MNDGIMILSGIGFLFVLGTTCLILDMIYNKATEVVYVKKTIKTKTSIPLEDDDDLVINDDVTQSNIFQE
jgi:hypothetical protein